MPTYTVSWPTPGSHTDTVARHVHADSPFEAGHLALLAHGHITGETTVEVIDEPTDIHAVISGCPARKRSFLIDDYARIALRLWASSDWHPPFTRAEALTIAGGWASEGFCPKLCAWVNGVDVPVTELITDAHDLWENLGLNTECWPYEGEPSPSIRAVASLTHYLEQCSDTRTAP
ncbi:hypothetical protein ACIGO9_29820 [Nocardia asteroides]|uniref:hypothetical protein n=1 Tax=Nocardia asteroides TaxID=1824 RepID=UPI0037C8F961